METVSPQTKSKLFLKWLLSTLIFLFLLTDSLGKLFQLEEVMKASEALGFDSNQITTIGVLLLVCSLLYMIPKYSVLGAILLTGYLGGAVAIHMHAHHPLYSHTLFPVYIGALLWLGLYFRNKAVVHHILKP